jgi:DNA primase
MSKINYQDIDVEEFLNDLGMHNVRKDGREIFFSCPFPGHSHGDALPSASMQIGTTKVHCFGCGFNGNALTFLAEYENISPLKAARYIREYLGTAFKEPEGALVEEIDAILSPKAEIKRERNKSLSKMELHKRAIDWREVWKYSPNDHVSLLRQMFDRGFSWQTLNEWQIGWDDISGRFTIPWFDSDGELIGFKGRAPNEYVGNGNARYKVLGGSEYAFDTFDVSMMLFGVNMLPYWSDWSTTSRLIIVEGELNTIALHQMGIGPAVGISGKTLSDEQVYLLKKYDRELILYFDEDADALKAANRLTDTNKTSIVASHEKDAADSTYDEVAHLIAARTSAIMLY